MPDGARGFTLAPVNSQVISIRPAEPADAPAIAAVHDASWREAYRGIIPGAELERMVERRGPAWWRSAVRRGAPIRVLDTGEGVRGYASYGRNRTRALPQSGEIFEIYLDPLYQGMGLGQRLFGQARGDLKRRGLNGLVVWALVGNERACGFYRHLGGRAALQGLERFGETGLERTAFVWR